MATDEARSQALMIPETKRGIITREVLTEAAEQRQLLGEYVKQQMIKGTDYGTIPGTPKPTLLKPGAEKLVELFRCTPKFKLVKTIEDYDHNLFAYTFRVQLYQRDSEAVLAEGYGSANSREGRYRWRNASRKCPSCGKETIIQGKKEYGGGWICFAKKGGCGAKFSDGDTAITEQQQGQVENEDVAALANTILKMAKKRSLVDGAIALARVSDMFTQDVEDLPGGVAAESAPPMSEEEEDKAAVVVDEFKAAMSAETDPRKLWRITEGITKAHKDRRVTAAQKDALVAFYKQRKEQLEKEAA